MATILKCKICGGDIEVNQDMAFGTCLYCGTTITLPRIDNDKKARLFNRANEYRLNCEFDKAYDAYKAITEEDEQEAEAYWGMILSEYGVEYVEDPKTNKRIPTCHRTIIQPIKSCKNYELACRYADTESKFIYQDEAEELDKLQKSILTLASQENPYDVFICYKELDDSTGERTEDSLIAQDIYNEFERVGIRTFFARVSLEDHLGENYEPYIYAALQSAKVMLVVSTTPENCASVWVKNEWSRYLGFMNTDASKLLIPVCKGMSPNSLPDELNPFQAQDYSKIGALQDLVHGVSKQLGMTPSQGVNKAVNDLVKENYERKQKTQNIKRKIKRILIAVLIIMCIAVAISAIVVGYHNSRIIHVSDGFPDNQRYDECYVDITKDNFHNFFKEYLDTNDEYNDSVKPLGYMFYGFIPNSIENGWILYDQDGFKAVVSYDSMEWSNEKQSFSEHSMVREKAMSLHSLPCMYTISIVGEKHSSCDNVSINEVSGTLHFISLKKLASYEHMPDETVRIIYKNGKSEMLPDKRYRDNVY